MKRMCVAIVLGLLLCTGGCGPSGDTGPAGDRGAGARPQGPKPLEPLAPLGPGDSNGGSGSGQRQPSHSGGPSSGSLASDAVWKPNGWYAHRLGPPTPIDRFYIQLPVGYRRVNLNTPRQYAQLVGDMHVYQGDFSIFWVAFPPPNVLNPNQDMAEWLGELVRKMPRAVTPGMSGSTGIEDFAVSQTRSGRVGPFRSTACDFSARLLGKAEMKGFALGLADAKGVVFLAAEVVEPDAHLECDVLMTSALTCRPQVSGMPGMVKCRWQGAAGASGWMGRSFIPKIASLSWQPVGQVSRFRLSVPFHVRQEDAERVSDGQFWMRKGSLIPLDEAEDYYTQYIKEVGDVAWAFGMRGAVREEVGNVDGAIEDFTAALRHQPQNVFALSSRSRLHQEKGDRQRALTDLETLAAAYAESGDFQNAIECQLNAMQLCPDDAEYQAEAQKKLDLFRAGQPYRE